MNKIDVVCITAANELIQPIRSTLKQLSNDQRIEIPIATPTVVVLEKDSKPEAIRAAFTKTAHP